MCGLIGFIPFVGKQIDLEKLKLLVIGAEERGIDSFGISVGNIFLEKALGKPRAALPDIISKLKEIDLTDQPIIAHTRKSSYAYKVTLDAAHPFKLGNVENDDEFVGAHNGLVTDTYNLYTKHILPYDNSEKYIDIPVDSLYLLKALKLANYTDKKSILASYEGNAALLFYDKDRFYVWKGANLGVVERTLYCLTTEEGYYFYSTPELLYLLGDGTVSTIGDNAFVSFDFKKRSFSVDIVNRQVKKTFPSYHNGTNTSVNVGNAVGGELVKYFVPEISPFLRITRKGAVINGSHFCHEDNLSFKIAEKGKNTGDILLHFKNGIAWLNSPSKATMAILNAVAKTGVLTKEQEKNLLKYIFEYIPITGLDKNIGTHRLLGVIEYNSIIGFNYHKLEVGDKYYMYGHEITA